MVFFATPVMRDVLRIEFPSIRQRRTEARLAVGSVCMLAVASMDEEKTPKGKAGGDARDKALSRERKKEIASAAAKAMWAKKKALGTTPKTLNSNDLEVISPKKGTTPSKHAIQQLLDLKPVKEMEIDGVGMGVLSDGTPYLTARGLARMCGVDHTKILEIVNDWGAEQFRPRGRKIADLLHEQGHDGSSLTRRVVHANQETHAYCDAVCMAFLEYYAFEASGNVRPEAQRNYRILARSSFRTFIYNRLGYDPQNNIPDPWVKFHDRVLLNYNNLPPGYYSVFREVADFIIYLMQQGMTVDEHSVPDGSVGRIWSDYWTANAHEEQYGPRAKYPHNYPDYFPQAQANPHDVWIYPDSSLGEFRRWMRQKYIPEKFPPYLKMKAKQGVFPASSAELLLSVLAETKALPSPPQ